MIMRVAAVLSLLMFSMPALAQEPIPVRFETITLCVDAGSELLAAWQIEVVPIEAEIEVIGIEGVSEPFDAPAYFDRKAGKQGRILVAAFTTNRSLLSGKQSVAILHLRKTGAGQKYDIHLQVAGNEEGEKIKAESWWSPQGCSQRRSM